MQSKEFHVQVLLLLTAFCIALADLPTGVLRFDSRYESFKYLVQPSWQTYLNKSKKSIEKKITAILRVPQKGDDMLGCKKLNHTLFFSSQGVKIPILFLRRGGCSFKTKLKNARAIGATSIAVANTYKSLYKGKALSCENRDCDMGSKYLPSPPKLTEQCSDMPKCSSKKCGYTGHKIGKFFQVCCIVDSFLEMSLGSTSDEGVKDYPSIFVSIEDGENMLQQLEEANGAIDVHLTSRKVPYDPSSIFLWAIGVITVIVGSYTASMQKSSNKIILNIFDEEEANLEIKQSTVVAFVIAASMSLSLFYFGFKYFPSVTFQFLVLVYCASSILPVASICIHPLLTKIFASCASLKKIINDRSIMYIAIFLAFVQSVFFFLCRKRAYSWIPQNIIGMCMCCQILRLARFPNLNVISLLLVLTFFYDIFFVFISPYFYGKSVMLTVATAGGADDAVGDLNCQAFCIYHPQSEKCKRSPGLPMLLRIPRFLDWRGGSSMLGLGDIVIPGVLLAYLLQFDVVHYRKRTCCTYYTIACIGYAVGLQLANLSVIIFDVGQPALLYIVPCTLGVVLLVSKCRGELMLLWNATHVSGNDNDLDYTLVRTREAGNINAIKDEML